MKQIDANGFWNIKNNPISKVGVFPYLGRQIDKSLEPDKIYMVLRPAEELFSDETINSFNENPVPLVDDHTMIGDEFTPPEQKGIDGVVQNIRRNGDKLVGDLSIYSTDLKKKIAAGKKDLSMGYFCTYDLEEGEYNGEHYDAIQRNIRSNHVALVDRGRCGHDVRVFDTWCFDCAIADENLNANKEEEMNINDANFEESKHPRASNGQFTSGGGGGASKSEAGENKENNNSPQLETAKLSINNLITKYGKESPYIAESAKTYLKQIFDPENKQSEEKKIRTLNYLKEDLEKEFKLYNEYKQLFEPLSEMGSGNEGYRTAKQWLEDYKNGRITEEKAFEKIERAFKGTIYYKPFYQYLNWRKSPDQKRLEQRRAEKKMEEIFGIKFSSKKKNQKNTASDGGVNASTCDADFQSKIEEIRTMIDKEKLSALKELVAMLESDSPAGDAKPCDELPNNEEKMDILEEKKEDDEIVKDEAVDKRELIREIGAIAGKGGLSEEDVRTLMQKAEQLAYSDSERSADDEEEEIVEEKIEEQPEEKKESEDALPQKIFEMIADRDALVQKIAPIIGKFDHSKMTVDQVAKYACDKLDIKSENPKAAIDGYLKGYKHSKMYSIDSAAAQVETTNSQIDKYLRGE